MPSVSMCYGCEFRWWYMQSEWRHAFGVSCLLDCGFLGVCWSSIFVAILVHPHYFKRKLVAP